MILSQQLGKAKAQRSMLLRPEEVSGKVRLITFDVLVDKKEGTFHLANLPAGKGRLLTTLCRIAVNDAKGSPVDIAITLGHEGFTTGAGYKVKASETALSPAVETGPKGMTAFGTFVQISGFQYDAMQPIAVVARTEEALEEGAEIHGTLFYAVD